MLTKKNYKDLLVMLEYYHDHNEVARNGAFVTDSMEHVYREEVEKAAELIELIKAEITCLNILESEAAYPSYIRT